MRVFTRRTLREFWERHPDARKPLLDWCQVVERADWNAPDRVKSTFASASILRGDRVVFNIKGNTYRLIAAIDYQYGIVYIRFVGTHQRYNKINAATI